MKRAKLIWIYGVYNVNAGSMVELFRSESKEECRTWRKENKGRGNNLKIGVVDTKFININK